MMLPVRFRIAARELAPEHADDVAAFKQREVERDFRNFARGKTDHEEASFPRNRTQRGFGEVAADRIIDHIHALAVGQRLQPLFQIFLANSRSVRPRRARFANSSFSGEEAQAITFAPMILPSSMAARPTPPDAPSTASVSPAFSLRAIFQRVNAWCRR